MTEKESTWDKTLKMKFVWFWNKANFVLLPNQAFYTSLQAQGSFLKI